MGKEEDFFEDVLTRKVVDIELLKRISYAGIPSKHRQRVYLILLGVLGFNTGLHEQEIKERQRKYETYFGSSDLEMVDKPFASSNPAQSLEGSTETKDEATQRPEKTQVKFAISEKTRHQILIDIQRISPSHRYYHNVNMSSAFYNVLAITAHKRPYIGYAQGMADLVVPFARLFLRENDGFGEALIFCCLGNLLNRIQDDIFNLQAEMLAKFEDVLAVLDSEVFSHLQAIGLEAHMYCFRWFSCLFVREFPIEAWFRIFDSMLCSCIKEFVVFFGVALVVWFRTEILARDFSSNVQFMQNLSDQRITDENIEELIGSVSFLRRRFYNDIEAKAP